jgi:hypothetical protein
MQWESIVKKTRADWIDTFQGWPADAETVRKNEGCALRTVQNWAAGNNVRTIGRGNRHQYLFFREDVQKFRQRERPGRRWPEKAD